MATQHARTSTVTQHVVTNTVTEKKNDGFKLNFTVQQGEPTGYGGRYPNSVIVNLNKTSGKATQKNQYTFNKHVKFVGSLSFSGGTFKATFPNNDGKLNMTFHPKGSTFTAHVPKGCKGTSGTARRGTLKGTFKLKAGGKIGTVTVKSIPATLSNALYSCNPASKGVQLFNPPTAKVGAYASAGSPSLVTIFSDSRGSGFDFSHTYTVKGPSSNFTYKSDLSSATLTGSNGMKGTATFTGTNKVTTKLEDGTMTGSSFSATMASVGKVTPFKKPAKGYQLSK
jgi:hypothetical protein